MAVPAVSLASLSLQTTPWDILFFCRPAAVSTPDGGEGCCANNLWHVRVCVCVCLWLCEDPGMRLIYDSVECCACVNGPGHVSLKCSRNQWQFDFFTYAHGLSHVMAQHKGLVAAYAAATKQSCRDAA